MLCVFLFYKPKRDSKREMGEKRISKKAREKEHGVVWVVVHPSIFFSLGLYGFDSKGMILNSVLCFIIYFGRSISENFFYLNRETKLFKLRKINYEIGTQSTYIIYLSILFIECVPLTNVYNSPSDFF